MASTAVFKQLLSPLLLLGGTGEALQLATRLAGAGLAVTYSLAGRAQLPQLPCTLRVGGFGGAGGLATFLRDGGYRLLIDATHPYAARISAHAALAAADVTIPLWAYRRPPWQPVPGDHWQSVADWAELMGVLLSFSRPFFTIGQEPLKHADQIPPKLHWLIRCLNCPPSVPPQMTVLTGRGPFRVEQELALMRSHGVDVLVSKNSGGSAIAAKLTAARQLGVPVVMLERPPLPPADLIFFDIEALAEAIWCA